MMSTQLIGFGLVLAALGADVALTLTNHTVPAIVASVATAGLGIVFPGVLGRKLPPTPPPPPKV